MDENTIAESTVEDRAAVSDYKLVKRYFSRVGFSLFWLLLVSLLLSAIAAVIINITVPEFSQSPWYIWLLSAVPMYLFAFPIFLYTLPKPIDRPLHKDKMSLKQFFMFLLMCFGIMYPLNLLGFGVSELLKNALSLSSENPLDTLLENSNVFINFIFAVLLAPVMEELIFRKLLIDRLARIDKRTALFFSALAFGFFHGNLNQFFYAYGLGLLFAFIYINTNRIGYTIGLHMIVNFIGIIAAPLVLSLNNYEDLLGTVPGSLEQMNQVLSKLPYIFVYLVYALVLFGAVIAGIYLLIKERRMFRVAEEDDLIPDEKAFSLVYLTWGVVLFITISAVMFVLSFL
jgi:membrane protease YdiL (CAAX protease family)